MSAPQSERRSVSPRCGGKATEVADVRAAFHFYLVACSLLWPNCDCAIHPHDAHPSIPKTFGPASPAGLFLYRSTAGVEAGSAGNAEFNLALSRRGAESLVTWAPDTALIPRQSAASRYSSGKQNRSWVRARLALTWVVTCPSAAGWLVSRVNAVLANNDRGTALEVGQEG